MELKEFSKLYSRIQTEPSILLLGQKYLCANQDADLLWVRLTEDYPNHSLSKQVVNYPALWEAVANTPTAAKQLMERICAQAEHLSPQDSFRTILDFRWSLLYTSSFDGSLISAAGENYALTWIPSTETKASKKYMNKDRHYCVPLCGGEDTPPCLDTPRNKHIFKQNIEKRIDWIADTYLQSYGVLVIDGWDPQHDWLTEDLLSDRLIQMPECSVFWFGAPENLEQFPGIRELLESRILVVEHRSLIQEVRKYMPEQFDSFESRADTRNDAAFYTTLTLNLDNNRFIPFHIPRIEIHSLNGDNLCLIDDDILAGQALADGKRAKRFANFLTQRGVPKWNLFRTIPGEKPFYIERDIDTQLRKAVMNRLKVSDGSQRKPVILDGASNSGKTTTLAKLALDLAAKRNYPVFFIHGELQAGAEDRISRFIHEQFKSIDEVNGERVTHAVLIWDGSSSQRRPSDYQKLQKALFTCNVLVIGSCYKLDCGQDIHLKQHLSSAEEEQMYVVLDSLGGDFKRSLKEIRRRKDSPRNGDDFLRKHTSLLYILQTLFKFEFDEEYRDVSNLLKQRFSKETRYSEDRTAQSMEEYIDDYIATLKEIAKMGPLASYQVKLQLYLETHFPHYSQGRAEPDEDDLERLKREKHQKMCAAIVTLNSALALSSEFGIELPLSLLLQLMRDDNGRRYVSYGSDTAQIISILQSDSLIESRYVSLDYLGDENFLRFRDPCEAENYICLLDDLPLGDTTKKRKDREYKILLELMDAAQSELDVRKIIEIIRQFGPNSHGKYSDATVSGDYEEYKDYWQLIAGKLIENERFAQDPEATLVYAHFLREAYQKGEHIPEELEDIRLRLTKAMEQLEHDGRNNSSQYSRLQIELCANLQQSIRTADRFDYSNYQKITQTIRQVFRTHLKGKTNRMQHTFSSNNLLDILLNAFLSYAESLPLMRDPDTEDHFQRELADRVNDISFMLDLDELLYSYAPKQLMEKIFKVYDYMEQADALLKKLSNNVERKNSDAYLFMKARRLWYHDTARSKLEKNQLDLLKMDCYLALCQDTFSYEQLSLGGSSRCQEKQIRELKRSIQADAQKVIEFLEASEQMNTIRHTKSERCVMMLLRAKWFCLGQAPMLAEKQRIAFTEKEWAELVALCRLFISFHDQMGTEVFAPAYFLCGVENWVNGNFSEAAEMFRTARADAYGDYLTMERLVLCAWETTNPRLFQVKLVQKESGKYSATILSEEGSGTDDQVTTRRNIGVPDSVLRYVFLGSNAMRGTTFIPSKPCSIHFNLSGPQLGIPSKGGSGK